jgi:hypothetical protein
MGLQEHAIDLFQVDGFGSVADSLEQCTEAEISDAAEPALGMSE